VTQQDFRGKGGRKRLQSAVDASAYQKQWFQDLRQRVADGEPCALVSAGAPEEILRAMDIPFVVNQWWAAVVSSRQKAPYYLGLLNEEGYSSHLCSYCSLPLASTLGQPLEDAPWGGLPKISMAVTECGCDSQLKIYGLWAQKHDIPIYVFERTIVAEPTAFDWWDKSRHEWESLYQTHRLDLMVAEMQGFIRFLEEHTGKHFDESALKVIMDRVNEQEEINAQTRDLIAGTHPAPITIVDSIPSVMIPQWHRGTEWGVRAAQQFYDEVKHKVDQGEAASPNEQIRLMWIGVGLWFNTGFYQYFQDAYGAVFVWSMYLALAADAYVRYGDDLLRTLAARYVSLTDGLRIPPWSTEWYIHQAKTHGIQAAVHLAPQNDCGGRQTYFINKGLEDAGIPVLDLGSDNVDSRGWDDEAIKQKFEDFLQNRVLTKGSVS
jgi:benzoyl-CoA reductase/2-hydroxyglutaryl-CoA dehydratase subunit BcrC/BadD/HgdB